MRGSSASQTANIAWLRCGPAKATTIMASSSDGIDSRVSRIWFNIADSRPWVEPATTPSTRPNSVAAKVTTKRRRRSAPHRSADGSTHRDRDRRSRGRTRLRHSATMTAATAGSQETADRYHKGQTSRRRRTAAPDRRSRTGRSSQSCRRRIFARRYAAPRRTLFQIHAIVGHTIPYVSAG